jgi:scyllo-inositol 2-dehydrogenase (NADP+)
MASSVNTVVVGYGFAGRDFHCYLVKLAPGLALHGVVSGSYEKRERISREQGCRAYSSLDEALSDRTVELVVLATPNSTHADLAVRCLDAGKHVVTDKVMCLSLADCDRMLEAARRNGRLLTVFQNRRFDGDYLTVRRLMDEGRIGDVRWIEMAWQGARAMGGWRGQAAMGGGRLYDLGAHLVDQLCQFFPQEIESVYCRLRRDDPATDAESEALVVVGFGGGRTGVCDFSSMASIDKPRFYVRGTCGTFCKWGLDPQELAMRAGDIDAAHEDPALYGTLSDGRVRTTVETLPGRWRSYYENIAAALRGESEPVVKPADMRRTMRVIDAAFRSAEAGQVVTA